MLSTKARIIHLKNNNYYKKVRIEIQPKKCRHILDEHIAEQNTVWDARMKFRMNLVDSYISGNRKELSEHEELITVIGRYILDYIDWPAKYPQYIETLEYVESLENTKVKYKRKSITFLCKNGLQIIASIIKKKSEKKPTYSITTAYFPIKVNRQESDYRLFLRSRRNLKKKYNKKIIEDKKHKLKRNILKCKFVSNEHWEKPSDINEYLGVEK